ncbi:cysteine-rich receptor-like protein kinase 8 [Tanacetum coccineum]
MNDINSHHHPLYFHPNDHLGLLLISKQILRSENYSTWRRTYWERANDMLISWILNTVSEHIGNNLTFINSAHALWNELHEHFSQLDGHRIYQLTNEIVDLKQSNCTIETYYHKLKGLWDELDAIKAPYACSCKSVCNNRKENDEREQRKRLIQFLMGLDECYTNIRGQILLMQPLPTAAKAYSMLRQEEKQRETKKQHSNIPIALNTYRSSYSPSYNSSQRNNNPNHPNTQPNTQSDRKNTFRKGILCGYCKKEGHSKEECFKLLGVTLALFVF